MATAEKILARADEAKTERATWDTLTQDLANYVMPRKAHITDKEQHPSTDKVSQLFDSTAIQANTTLGQGQMSYLSPHDDQWFEFRPPYQLKSNDRVIKYYEECTFIAAQELALSNFYTEVHEMYLQRSGFGTAAMFQTELDGQLYFRNYDFGTYSIVEDVNGFVDEFYREWQVSARQLRTMFPDSETTMPSQVRELWGTPKEMDKKFDMIHAVLPRDAMDRGPDVKGPEGMPFASIYILRQGMTKVHESGFTRFPFLVTRYLRWSNSLQGPYGWCPTMAALADIRQVNLLQKYMDVLAEVSAFPRILKPSDLDGEVDLRAGGITQFNPYNQQALPKEWATQGRYDIGKDRIEMRQKAIKEHFHTDLFRMFAELDRGAQMSIRETVERSSEKLAQFSPTFTRLISEGFNPMLKRTFELLTAMGKFPDPPPELVEPRLDGKGDRMPDPQLQYTSRLAMALNSIQNSAALQTLEAIMPMAQVDPTILDTFNMDNYIRGFARNAGVPEDWLRDTAEVQAIREQRAAMQQERMELENQQMAQEAAAPK
jgi:hypothetical protein